MDNGWRLATETEIQALRAEPGAPHVDFGCIGCGMVNWHAKNLAVSSGGHYNHARNIFVADWTRGECSCSPDALRVVVPEKVTEPA
jgi:hypothetical protein